MGVSSYIEFTTTLFSWIMYDKIWSVLAASGVVYLPFIIIIFAHITQSMKGGDDQGAAAIQSLKKIQTDVIVGIFVLFFVAVPFYNVSLGQMHYVKPSYDCRVVDDIAAGTENAVVTGTSTGTTYDAVAATIGGQTGRIPVWWGGVHVITKSVVSASVAGIPCTGAMSAVNMALKNEPFRDQRVNREVQEFIRDCYMPAKSEFLRSKVVTLPAQNESTGWLGSEYFMTRGYTKYYSKAPRAAFAFNPLRDVGYEAEQAIGGHPLCSQWWPTLRTSIINSINPRIMDHYVYRTRNLVQAATPATLSTVQREDVFLRKYLAVKISQGNVSGFRDLSYSVGAGEATSGQWGNVIDAGANYIGKVATDLGLSLVAGVGAAMSAPGHLASGVAAREGSPIFLSLILMAFVIALPVLLVVSLYNLKNVMILTVMFFALHFTYVFWGIAFWIDNHLTTALTSGPAGVFAAVTNPSQSLIILWIQRLLYGIFPLFWFFSLTWAGFRAAGSLGGADAMAGNVAGSVNSGVNSGINKLGK